MYTQRFGNKYPLKSAEYYAWSHAKQRCSNPNVWNFKNYGGRGIKFCSKWMNNFEAFLKDVGERPSKQHSLNRIDNDGDYEPGNVEWSTKIEQSRNRRHYKDSSIHKGVHWYPHKGIKKWQVTIGVNRKLISVGYYEQLEEAISARLTAESLYW